MSERDPRVDPRPGDVLRKVTRSRYGAIYFDKERQVDEVDSGIVTYVGPDVCAPSITLRSWQRWAQAAEVIRRAEDAKC